MSDDDWGVMPLANPDDLSDDPRLVGLKLQVGEDGKGQYAGPTPEPAASLSGATPTYATHHSERQGLMGTQMAATKVLPPGTKAQPLHPHDSPMTQEKLMAQANKLLREQNERNAAALGVGAAVGDRDDSGRPLPAWLKIAAGR